MALAPAFADKLRTVFREGLSLSERDMEGLGSACGAGDREGLLALLAEDGPGRDLFLSLAFAPGEDIREMLEECLAGSATGPEDEEQALSLVRDAVSTCRVALPCGGSLDVIPPAWAKEAFVKALGLARTLPAELREAVEDFAAPTLRPAVRAALREAPLPWSGEGARLATRLVAGGLAGDREGLAALRCVLGFLPELRPGEAPGAVLFRKAAWAKKHLAAAERETDAPFELRMALGLRPAYVDRARMEAVLAGSLAAARALYGPGFLFPENLPEDGGEVPVDLASFLAMGREG